MTMTAPSVYPLI